MDYHHLPSLTRLPQPWRTLLDSYFATAGDAYCVMLPDEATDAANGPLPADRFWGGEQIHWVNEAMTLLLGQSADQLVGLPAADLFAHDPAVGQELWQKLGQNDVIRQEVRVFRSDGALISVDCECHTVLSTEGERLGHILSLKNNPRQQHTVDNRLYLADAIKEAQHIAQIGSWEMSLTSNEMLWSDEIFRILEVDKRAFAGTQEAFRALIPEEEVDVIRQKFWDCVERREPYEMIHRLRMSDGRIKYVHELAKVIYDRKGQPLRAIGTMQDITLLRKREAESLLQQDLLQSVFNAVYATDLQLKITSWNRAAEELYGWRQEEVIGQPIAAIMQPEYVQATAEEVLEQLFTKGYWQGEARLRNKAGHMLAVLAAARLLRDRHGEIIGVVGVSHDISEFIATQHALRESEGRLKRAETLAKIGHCAFSIDLKEVVLSDGLKEIWGYTVDENPEVDELLSRLHPEDRFAVAAMQEAAAEKRGFDVEYRLLLPDKSIRHLHSVYEYVPGSETEMPRYFGTMLDITTRVQAMVLLESSQQQLNSQYQKLPVPTYTYQRQGDEFFLIDFNEAAIKVTSGAIEQFRGKTLAETIFGRQDLIANVQTCYREQSTLRAEIDYMYPSSGEVHILRTTYVYAPPDLVMIFVEEITDQRRAEASLLLSEERLKQAVRVGNIGIFDHDHATGHLFWSPEMRRFYGWGEDEDIGIETLIAQTHAEDRTLVHELAGKAHDPAGNGLFDTDHRIVNRAGEVRWISTRSETLFEGQGDARHPVRTIGAIVDVTESRRVADELRIKEAAIESAINGIVIADHQGDILYVNPSFRRIWGYEQDRDVVGQSINAHWCYGSAAGPAQESMLAAGSWIGDVVGIRPDGSRFDAQLSSSIVFDQAGQPQYQMYAILDLTRRKRDEEFLRTLNKAALAMQRALEPAAVFTAVADELSNIGLNCGIFTLTEDGGHLQVQHLSHNQAAVSRALKLTSLDLSSLKIPVARVDAFRIPITQQKTILLDDIVETTRQFLPGPLRGLAPRVVKILNVPKSINAPMMVTGGVVGLFSVQSADLTEEDVPTITAFGNQMAAAWQQAKLYQQAQSELNAREEAENEVRRLNVELEERVIERTTQLEMANKELEAFSYSVSHDLRAPLRAIDGYTRFLLEDYRPLLDEEGQRICDIIRGETQRMGYLIDELLSFSRLSRTTLQTSAVDMADLAQTVMTELCASEDVTRIKYVQGRLGPARGDKALLRQVWQNLLSNAIKFSANVDTAVIEVSSETKGLETVYTIRDNGAGFDMDYADKLFGVFQRLHSEREFEGTGVGLAIVQRIINRHGGRVWAEGAVDEGATFYFSLPRKEKQA